MPGILKGFARSTAGALALAIVTAGTARALDTLQSGNHHTGSLLSAGEMDNWTITLAAGDTLILRTGTGASGSFTPRVKLLDPDGHKVADAWTNDTANRDAEFAWKAAGAGTYTVQVSSYFTGGTGSYTISPVVVGQAFVVLPGEDGGALANGGRHAGNILLGDIDAWSIDLSAGQVFAIRAASPTSGGFSPRMQIYGPDGTRIGDSWSSSATNRVADLLFTVPQTGTYLVVMESALPGGTDSYAGTGSYTIYPALNSGSFITPSGDQGGALTSGTPANASILAGDFDTWEISAAAGQDLIVQMNPQSFKARFRIYDPNGTLVADGYDENSATNPASVTLRAPITGTYRIIAFAFNPIATGSYTLTATAQTGSAPPANDGTSIANGQAMDGSLGAGEQDAWSFDATAGDAIRLQAGVLTESNADFGLRLELYGPDGSLLGSFGPDSGYTSSNRAAVAVHASLTGTYHAVVRETTDTYWGNSATYRLYLSVAPGAYQTPEGDQGGSLVNGGAVNGQIDAADIDEWSFDAAAGDAIRLQAGVLTESNADFGLRLELYGPDGSLLGSFGPDSDYTSSNRAAVAVHAPLTGTYRAVVRETTDTYWGNSATYRLYLSVAPGAYQTPEGDQGGSLVNGGAVNGQIDAADIDEWSFDAAAGDAIRLQAGVLTESNADFGLRLELYGPDGSLLGSFGPDSDYTSSSRAAVAVHAPLTGTYRAVVRETTDTYWGNSATYRLSLARSPATFSIDSGDEGGPLESGENHVGQIESGDLDLWSFTGNQGDRVIFRMSTSSVAPLLQVFGPDGELAGEVSSSSSSADVSLTFTLPAPGAYNVIVAPSDLGTTGGYTLRFAQLPGTFTTPGGDDGGPLVNGSTTPANLDVGDIDLWSFTATAGESVILRMSGASTVRGHIRIYGPTGALLDQAFATSTGRDTQLGLRATTAGTYTVITQDYNSGGHGTYALSFTSTTGTPTIDSGDEGGPFEPGSPMTGSLTEGDLDIWTINLSPGQIVTIQFASLGGTSSFMPGVSLFAPDGTPITTATFTASQAGNYTVIVSNSNATGTGSYSLGYALAARELPGRRPVVSITGRKVIATKASRIQIKGRASDDGTIAYVEFQAPGARYQRAHGTRNWAFTASLRKFGRNVIKVRAVDGAGQKSAVQQIAVNRRR